MRRHSNQVAWHLKQIRREFLLHRRGKSKCKSYPPRLRALAMEGIAAGIAGIRIAKAAGVSTQSLVNWGKDTGSTATPRELVIVEDDSSSAESSTPTASNHLVSIQFRSGIRMELSPVILTTELMLRLNEVGR